MPLHDVRLAQFPGIPLAVVRRTARGPELATVVPACCGEVWKFVRGHNLKAGRNVAIYWNGEIRLEVGVEMEGAVPPDSQVVASATPAGLAASVVHFGPYGQLGLAHAAIRQWCGDHGHQIAGPNWEIYGHWQKGWDADPSLIRTDVFYKVTSGPQIAS